MLGQFEIRDLLFSILRRALWNQPFEVSLDAKATRSVLHLAEEQTIFGLVFEVLSKQDVKIEMQEILDSIVFVQAIRQQNLVKNNVLADFVKIINKQSIDYLVVKGQTIACLYPEPYLRMSGDIDYLIWKNYSTVKDRIEEVQQVVLPSKIVKKEISYEWHNVIFELHTSLIDLYCGKHQHYWDQLIKGNWQDRNIIEIDGVKVYTLPVTLNAVYLFLHIYSHFSKVGVSLRQLCDWGVFLHYYDKRIDREKVQEILRELGLKEFFCAFGTILVGKLGLPEYSFPIQIDDSHREWTEKILSDIFRGGNFGRMKHKSKISWLFKMESICFAIRNSFRYYRLAPSEMRMMIPKMVSINLRVLTKI